SKLELAGFVCLLTLVLIMVGVLFAYVKSDLFRTGVNMGVAGNQIQELNREVIKGKDEQLFQMKQMLTYFSELMKQYSNLKEMQGKAYAYDLAVKGEISFLNTPTPQGQLGSGYNQPVTALQESENALVTAENTYNPSFRNGKTEEQKAEGTQDLGAVTEYFKQRTQEEAPRTPKTSGLTNQTKYAYAVEANGKTVILYKDMAKTQAFCKVNINEIAYDDSLAISAKPSVYAQWCEVCDNLLLTAQPAKACASGCRKAKHDAKKGEPHEG
ncbi:MAG: hypothetical protein ACKVTZ_03515, partial [Bacteroidia bacterium]